MELWSCGVVELWRRGGVELWSSLQVENSSRQSKHCNEHTILQEEGSEPLVHLKEDKGNMLKELENCSDSQIREMVPHI